MTQTDLHTSPIAAMDIGTNSFHLIIASVTKKGALRVHSRSKEMVRLGCSGSGDMSYLQPDAIERGIAALKRFADIAGKANAKIRAIATSAVREADNKDEFIERAANEAGVEVKIVSGAEESRLIYLGVIHALPIYSQQALVFDIGGGSAETIIGLKGDVIHSHSAKLGAVRLTQRFFPQGVAERESIEQCREYIKGEFASAFQQLQLRGFEIVAATSGTVHAIGAMILAAKREPFIPDIINGTSFDRSELLRATSKIIAATTPQARSKIPGLDSGRADIILAGALILEQIILGLNIESISLSAFALREGTIYDIFQQQNDISKHHHLSNLRYETVCGLGELYRVNTAHAEHVRILSLMIFDALQINHRLGDKERELLEAAALLHDVGYHISPDQHHKHSYYIISHCVMPGFTNDEAEIIANIALYHRKSHPKRKHENFAALSQVKQTVISTLAGILRIAEGLDRRQQQYVTSLRLSIYDGDCQIVLCHNFETMPDVELWGGQHRKALLEEHLGIAISMRLDDSK